ncbi:MAG: SpoIIE family protein phosphatase [Christensenellaceae bacterium]|nr:SpoIIE family protein phosphatase [Christensenellaceae bacterium]
MLGFNVFTIPFYMSLIYNKKNILLVSFLYISSKIIFTINLLSVVLSASPIVILLIAYFVHFKRGRNINLLHINIYLFLSLFPAIVLMMLENFTKILDVIILVLLSHLIMNCSIIMLFRIFVRKLLFKFTKEEIFATSVWLIIIGIGFKSLSIDIFDTYYMILTVLIIIALFINKKTCHFVSMFLGIGASLYLKNPSGIALSILYGLTTTIFTKETHWFAGLAIAIVDIIYRVYFNINLSLYTIIPPLLGSLIVSFLPYKLKARWSGYYLMFKDKQTPRSIINRDRKLLSSKLMTLSNVFSDISLTLMPNATNNTEFDVNYITRESYNKCCKVCPSANLCQDGITENHDIIVKGLVSATIQTGRASILEAPPIVTSRCKRINSLISSVNEAIDRYQKKQSLRTEFDSFKVLVSNQMNGVSKILASLSSDFDSTLQYDRMLEEKLIYELNAHNIITSDALVYSSNKTSYSAIVNVYDGCSDQQLIANIVSSAFGIPMCYTKKENTIQGMSALRFEKKATYQIIYGDRSRALSAEGVNGDCYKALRLSYDKVILILSDGMGHGSAANRNSNIALNLIESFYMAGFEYTTIANTLSGIFSFQNGEEFSAVDIALINTVDGYIDFIKFGGRESFIVSNGVEITGCGSLPLGILDEPPAPYIERKIITSSCFLVMVSDGVLDTIGCDEMNELLSTVKGGNPDAIAELIINDYDRMSKEGGGCHDDASVLVAKIYKSTDSY